MAKTRSASLICAVSDVQFDLEISDPEQGPGTSQAAIAKDTVLISKAKQISIRAQSDILKQSMVFAILIFY